MDVFWVKIVNIFAKSHDIEPSQNKQQCLGQASLLAIFVCIVLDMYDIYISTDKDLVIHIYQTYIYLYTYVSFKLHMFAWLIYLQRYVPTLF
jgi:hypothetical protein